MERIEYPFEAVADSRSYAEQPLEPVTLQFSGTAPLQISAPKLSFDVPFRSVQLRLTNQSNLDIRNATCRLEYLNTAGEALGNHSIWLTSPNYQSTAMSLLVNKGATTERKETAFHAPDGTASVTATPTQIVADGTVLAAIGGQQCSAINQNLSLSCPRVAAMGMRCPWPMRDWNLFLGNLAASAARVAAIPLRWPFVVERCGL